MANTLELPNVSDLDGRTKAARAVRDTRDALLLDIGGEARASEAQRQLAHRLAVLNVALQAQEARYLAGGGMNLAEYLPAMNAWRRLVATLGTRRRAARVALHEYAGAPHTPQRP